MKPVQLLPTWQIRPLYLVLVGVWVLTMIALPIVRWTAGAAAFNWGVSFSVLLQAVVVFVIVWDAWGARRTLATAVVIAVLAWALEFLGSTTGFPFGAYDYTDALQPQLGHVPLLIPLAWFMMLPVAWAVAELIVGLRRRWRFVIVSMLAFTAWDLFLDPQMVDWGYWVWENPAGYFGIPWSNYGGWLLGSALLTAVAMPVSLGAATRPLLLIYSVTWFLESFGLILFWGLVGPGLVGMLGMGVFMLLAWCSLLAAQPDRSPAPTS